MALASKFNRWEAQVRHSNDQLTPAEIADLVKHGSELPFAIRPLLEAGQPPVRYVRERWCEDADYYTSNQGARSLIVGFCSGAHRLGVPTSYFLQCLRDDLYDVVVLRDARRAHFADGVQGLGSLLETTRAIKKFAEGRGYSEIISLGVSMGGYPALRAGLMLKADRAISIGGAYCWHVGRLTRKTHSVKPFDLLCPCTAKPQVELVAVMSAQNRDDVRALETLKLNFPECHSVFVNAGEHNVSGYFYQVGTLRLFYASLLEYWRDLQVRSDLLVMLEQVSALGHLLKTKQEDRISVLSQACADAREKNARIVQECERKSAQLQRVKGLRKKALTEKRRRFTSPQRILAKALRRLRARVLEVVR
jgi:hypothetical protein